MADLLLQKNTRQQLNLVLKSPPHALMICGQPGIGKTALAELISSELLGLSVEKLDNYPYFTRIVRPDGKQEIPIDAVRAVIRQLTLKPVIGQGTVRRIVLIEEAESMSTEAQNALLKAIEEPPPATLFILLASSDTAVLPTIASRSQRLKAGTVNLNDAIQFFHGRYDQKDIASAWQLSAGSAGLMSALLRQDNGHQLKAAVEKAKKLLKLGRYDRILYLDQLSGDKGEFTNVLEALARILSALHRAAVKSGNQANNKRLTESRKQVNLAIKHLGNNVSPRLIALDLATHLTV